MKSLPLTALAATLALAACNNAPETTDNAAVNVGDAVDLNAAAFNDSAPLVEDVSEATTQAVVVAAVPKLAAGTPAAEAAPRDDAAEIEEEIRAGTGIQRVRYGDGWAWTRGGRTIRTADRDGGNVAYFRRGETNPFFVQRGDRAYAYQGDRPIREFDRDGRTRAPEAERMREASEAVRRAREQRERAEQARETARDRDPKGPGRDRPTATPSPTPSASPTARPPRDRDGRPGWTRPTPSPTPTDRPRRDRDG